MRPTEAQQIYKAGLLYIRLGLTLFQLPAKHGYKIRPKASLTPSPTVAAETPSVQRTETATPCMPFGKHRGLPITEIPHSYLQWLAGLHNLYEPLHSAVQDELGRRIRANEIQDAVERWVRRKESR